jgi:plasmid stabilization system protein ParE
VSTALDVELSQIARQQVRAASKWWRINRTKAPNAVREELERVSALIAFQPSIGALATDVDLPGVRRVHIDRIHYYIYYRVVGRPEYIEILSFWSSLRGSPPRI